MTLKLSRKYILKTFFPNKKIQCKCIYLIPRRVTIDTNLHRFQYKILNNVLYLNEKHFEFKIVSSPLCSFCSSENEIPIHLFYSCNQRKSLWSNLQKLLNSGILLPQNAPQSAFFGFPINKKILKPLTICILSIIYI